MPDYIEDERGFFARTFCRREFEDHGLNPDLVQCNISFNHKKGTLRGMHYQAPPHAEAKLVRCTAGAVYDVIVDLRHKSPTFMQWHAEELSADNHRMIYIPEGFSHGFQTLIDNTEVIYHHSAYYSPEYERGLKFNDPALAIVWPLPVSAISAKDQNRSLLGNNLQGIGT